MRKLLIAAAFAASCLPFSIASGQTFPSKPVTIIVPFVAGGPPDKRAGVLGVRMRATLNQTVIAENATGAPGTFGAGRAAGSPVTGDATRASENRNRQVVAVDQVRGGEATGVNIGG
jgi:tripartite-type tricarboxylate transporter receptor subunit TctC